MNEPEAAAGPGTSKVLRLCGEYDILNQQRIDVDRRIMALAPDGTGSELLWNELSTVLTSLGVVVDRLARASAKSMAELRAKAAVLVSALRADDGGREPVIPDAKLMALALSVAEDLANIPG